MRKSTLLSAFFCLLALALQAAPHSALMLKTRADSLMNREHYSQALECYIQAMEQAEQDANQSLFVACIGNIANIYAISGEFERSEYYNRQGYEAALRQGDRDLVGKFLINSVGIYCSMNMADKARQQLSLMEQHPLSDTVLWRFYTMHYGGRVASMEHDYPLAHSLAQQALHYARQHHMEPRYELVQLGEIGNYHLQQGQPAQALRYFRQHLAKTDSLNSSELQASSCRLMAEAYEQAGHADSALFYNGMYRMLRDSAIDQRQLAAAKEKLYQYENRRTGQQISSLNEQVSRQWVLLGVLVGLLLLSVLGSAVVWRKNHRSRVPSPHEGAVEDFPAPMKSDKTAAPDARTPIYLNQEQVRELAARIDAVMQDISLISQPDFSLQSLAASVESNTKYVSYAINEVYGKTFKTVLNELRIEEAARRLSDQEHYGNITIQGIYQDLGYNSASAFIQAFKKVKGMTPSQFQKQQL